MVAYTTIYKAARNGSPALYLVFLPDGKEAIGMLEKYRDTRTDKHPWKAFAGFGMSRTFLGSFYPNEGGKAAALLAIEERVALATMSTRQLEAYQRILRGQRTANTILIDPEGKNERHTKIVDELLAERSK